VDSISKEIEVKKNPVLQSTKDYSKFVLCDFNRNVEKKKFLRESMEKHGYIPAYPMHCIVGDKGLLQIKAGHHRFEVARELGIAVYYVISNDMATIHELEKSTTRWTYRDYLESFAKCGNKDYQQVKWYHEETGIPIALCVSMLADQSAGSGNCNVKFKFGEFAVVTCEHIDLVADIVLHCKALGIKATDAIFVQALSRCVRVKEFSPEVFKTRATANSSMFKPCRSVQEQTVLFENVYNMKSKHENKLPLVFLTNQAMAARNAIAAKKKGQPE
jgi:hypothetical protein